MLGDGSWSVLRTAAGGVSPALGLAVGLLAVPESGGREGTNPESEGLLFDVRELYEVIDGLA